MTTKLRNNVAGSVHGLDGRMESRELADGDLVLA